MDIRVLLQGILLGFSIAAPVGPIGILCIRRTLVSGQWIGLLTGLGAATADAIYGGIAGLGLTLITSLLVDQQLWVRGVGGGFLCWLGIRMLLSLRQPAPVEPPTDSPEELPLPSLWAHPWSQGLGAYGSALFLTLTNPATILSFVAIFAGLGLGTESGSALLLVCGVFLGSSFWWLLLSGGISLFRHRFTPQRLQWVSGISGLVITGFGLIALISVVTG